MKSGAPEPLLLRRYQMPCGDTTPNVLVPLASQSPTTGAQPAPPSAKEVKSGAPELLLLRRYQVAVAGSTTPTVKLPLPSQSPTTGSQPGPPYWKAPASGTPALTLLRKYQVHDRVEDAPLPLRRCRVRGEEAGVRLLGGLGRLTSSLASR
jgi:hypothetical protein